jgi:O-antigen ligase
MVVLAAAFLARTGGKSAIAALAGILAIAWAFERWRSCGLRWRCSGSRPSTS